MKTDMDHAIESEEVLPAVQARLAEALEIAASEIAALPAVVGNSGGISRWHVNEILRRHIRQSRGTS